MAASGSVKIDVKFTDRATPVLTALHRMWRLGFIVNRAIARAQRRDRVRDALSYGTKARDDANYSAAQAWALVSSLNTLYYDARRAAKG